MGIRVGDIGTVIEITIVDQDGNVVDISTASSKIFKLRRIGESSSPKDATFTTDGTDGKLRYVLADGDIDDVGQWDVQAHISFPGGNCWSSSTTSFFVDGNL